MNGTNSAPSRSLKSEISRPFKSATLARSAVWAVRKTKMALRKIPAVRRLYYSLVNAEAFDDLFWHDLMLADTVRVDHYARAIGKHVQPGMVVLDLGTGSGILACLAARCGAKVYAVEHAGIIERARELARRNGLGHIQFFHQHSRDFRPSERVDVLLHEQIGMSMVDEDMVENILELRQRVLKPRGMILPGFFSLYIDPVELRQDRRLPYLWEQRLHGLDFSSFKPERPPWAVGSGYDKRALDPGDVSTFLAKRQSVLELDLHNLKSPRLPAVWEYETVLEKAGRLDGFCLYFSIRFDDQLGFETGPGSPATCWGSRLLRCEARQLAKGTRLRFSLNLVSLTNASSWTWQYSVSE